MVKRACAWRYSTNGTNGGSTLLLLFFFLHFGDLAKGSSLDLAAASLSRFDRLARLDRIDSLDEVNEGQPNPQPTTQQSTPEPLHQHCSTHSSLLTTTASNNVLGFLRGLEPLGRTRREVKQGTIISVPFCSVIRCIQNTQIPVSPPKPHTLPLPPIQSTNRPSASSSLPRTSSTRSVSLFAAGN